MMISVRENLMNGLSPAFLSYCRLKGIDINKISFKFIEKEEYYLWFSTIIPNEYILPCENCGKDFNSSDDYICFKDLYGMVILNKDTYKVLNKCEECFDYLSGRRIFTLSIVSNEKFSDVFKRLHLKKYLKRYINKKRNLKK